MFGPDVCGAQKRVHLIFHHNGKNFLTKEEFPVPKDTKTHLYRLTMGNPELKDWEPNMMTNLAYKGEWKPSRIPNPAFKEDPSLEHYRTGGVGLDYGR
ncbi:hypothetical protein BGZ95_007675 [Linnemannia exigua]|uniref:Uncharacterized protein n=1 Tax=Linnemannia exigua TaxID=604196 RepID=A0AAD4D1Y8_9FUNG|nr:hypothetical protein BGZ95_007675 [Linnemannia exigua]